MEDQGDQTHLTGKLVDTLGLDRRLDHLAPLAAAEPVDGRTLRGATLRALEDRARPADPVLTEPQLVDALEQAPARLAVGRKLGRLGQVGRPQRRERQPPHRFGRHALASVLARSAQPPQLLLLREAHLLEDRWIEAHVPRSASIMSSSSSVASASNGVSAQPLTNAWTSSESDVSRDGTPSVFFHSSAKNSGR